MLRLPLGLWLLFSTIGPLAAAGQPAALGHGEAGEAVSESEWRCIRASIEEHGLRIQAARGAFRADNRGQHWSAQFDDRGFTLAPDAGGWKWGLALERWGFESRPCSALELSCSSAEGSRFACERSAALTEWCVNESRGLEHGFTLREAPAGEGQLSFTFAVRGGLRPQVEGDGRGVSFRGSDDLPVLTYGSLAVLDAQGRMLPAGFELVPQGLRILVDASGAAYPLTIDPLVQPAYLKASNTDAGDEFGSSVAISGDTLAVGADFESGGSPGVNGNQGDNSKPQSGAVYVFVHSHGVWRQQAYLKAVNPDSGDHFGNALALDGDTLVVGAYLESSGATGVNGDPFDNSQGHSGAAYVFVRNGATWSQQAYLKASNTGSGDFFGISVALSGDTALVGALGEDSDATGVNGNQNNENRPDSGAAYVFVRNGTNWSQDAYLKASNTDSGDSFGWTVALAGDTAALGAPLEASGALGVNGNQGDNSVPQSGAVYVFTRSASTWSQQAYLKACNTDAGDYFGRALACSGETVVVGAPLEDSSATWVNGNPFDNSAPYAGAAYVFARSGTSWSQQAYFKAPNGEAGDYFGRHVAISGDMALVGAILESSQATGTNGDPYDNSAPGSGAAYVYRRTGTTWIRWAYCKASNTEAGDLFGGSVAISGGTAVVGAPLEDSSATGTTGNQADNSAPDAGAAYVIEVPASTGLPFCFGDGSGVPCPCANSGASGHGCENSASTGGAQVLASGTPDLLLDTVQFTCWGELPSALSVVLQGSSGIPPAAFGDGLRCTGGVLKRLYVKTAVQGVVTAPEPGDPSISARSAALGDTLQQGATRCYQVYYRDPDPGFCPAPQGATFSASSGLQIVWG